MVNDKVLIDILSKAKEQETQNALISTGRVQAYEHILSIIRQLDSNEEPAESKGEVQPAP